MINTKLIEIRKERGLTLEEVAKAVGISTTAVHYYEQGKRKIPKEIAEQMADFYGVEQDKIFLPETFSIR